MSGWLKKRREYRAAVRRMYAGHGCDFLLCNPLCQSGWTVEHSYGGAGVVQCQHYHLDGEMYCASHKTSREHRGITLSQREEWGREWFVTFRERLYLRGLNIFDRWPRWHYRFGEFLMWLSHAPIYWPRP